MAKSGIVRSGAVGMFAFAVALLWSFALAGGALAGGAEEPVAVMSVDPGTVEWLPHVGDSDLVLTVSGPGDVYLRKEFAAGSNPFLGIADESGVVLPEGPYVYELVVIPAVLPAFRDALNAAGSDQDMRSVIAAKLVREGIVPETPLVQSGGFSVEGGAFVGPADEGPRGITLEKSVSSSLEAGLVDQDPGGISPLDFPIADDLIVQGSACVGFDCVNGENFGFDTLRLKENNLRIKFDDTSNSSSFPANDWQLTANDSANGGLNKFSVDDVTGAKTPFTIEAGARTNALYVEQDGDIGLGTSNPVVDLHIVTGNTPAMRLEQDGTSGFTPQTWDVAGNEANFFVRDVTNGSQLPLRIQPGADNNSIYVASNNNVGIGTASPQGSLHIENTGTDDIDDVVITNDGDLGVGTLAPQRKIDVYDAGNDARIAFHTDITGTGFSDGTLIGPTQNGEMYLWNYENTPFYFGTNNLTRMRINGNGNVGIGTISPDYPLHVTAANGAHVTAGGVWTNGSSREYKDNIVELGSEAAFEALNALEPVEYSYKNETGEKYVGFIAEDVPELVAQNDRKSLSPMDIVAVLTKVVQDLQAKVAELNTEVGELRAKLVVGNP